MSPTQLSTQCVDYSFAVISALLLEDLDANALADLPIEQDQRSIQRLRDTLAGIIDQFPQIVEQLRRRDRRECSRQRAFASCNRLSRFRHVAEPTGMDVLMRVLGLEGFARRGWSFLG